MNKLFTGMVVGTTVFGFVQTAGAVLMNSGFETGDLTAWTVFTDGDAIAEVVTSDTVHLLSGDVQFLPQEGAYFAKLNSGEHNSHDGTSISQQLTWKIGDKLTFDWNFLSRDNLGDDTAFLKIESPSHLVDEKTLYDAKKLGPYYSDHTIWKTTGWNTYEYVFDNSGTGAITFGVFNTVDQMVGSLLYIDDVQYIVDAPSATSVPEPTTMLLFGAGLAGLAAARRKTPFYSKS